MKIKKITVIGLGGVGGYFGFKIARLIENNPNYEITFVSRGATYETVQNTGLTLISPEHPQPTVRPDRLIEHFSDMETPDLILICVKEYDLENVCHQIKDKITDDTVIVALMNGADIYDRIRKIIAHGTLLPTSVHVASHIKEKGIVEHKGNPGKIVAGKDPNHKNTNVDWVISLFKDSGADIIFKEDSFADIWIKFFFIASFGLVSARYNKSIGQICEEDELKRRATKIMEEIKEITDNMILGIPSDIIEATFIKAATFPYGTPTSLQLDVTSKKEKNELELFAGTIINYGTKFNIDTKETQKIYNEIREMLK